MFKFIGGPLTLVLCVASSVQSQPLDLQAKANAAEWRWSDAENSLQYCLQSNLKGFKSEIKGAQRGQLHLFPCRIAISNGNRQVFEFAAHGETVFTQIGDVIYVVQVIPIASGATVLAYDLKVEKKLWETHLNGNPPVGGHSKYRHRVIITNEDGVVIVYGKESNGRYIEYLDGRTGEIVGHKKLPREN